MSAETIVVGAKTALGLGGGTGLQGSAPGQVSLAPAVEISPHRVWGGGV